MHGHPRLRPMIVVLTLLLLATAATRAQHPPMPPGMTHEEHMKQLQKEADLRKRGAAAMGFDQGATTHHFTLTAEGGRIEVTANEPSDAKAVAAIRAHLSGLATALANGSFSAPTATHDEVPPGALTLQRLRGAIQYQYEDRPHGGRVRVATVNPEARTAIHDFLRYQIREHATGDPLTIEK